MDMHTTIEELLGAVFSMWSVPRLYSKSCLDNIRGLNLAVVKLTTIQETKLPL
jgi:hypothetical protein